MMLRRYLLAGFAVSSAAFVHEGRAEAPLPSAAELAAQTAKRFPQPVRVGDIVGQDVLKPVESQPVLGRVEAVRQGADGGVAVVVALGGVFGIGARLVAVPADALAYLGPQLALMGYTPEQAQALPTAADAPSMAGNATVKLGIVRPFH